MRRCPSASRSAAPPSTWIRHHVRVSNEASDRDQRGYELMQQRIESFRDGRLSIGSIIADLEGLVHALEVTPQVWKDSFVEEWSVLEIAYAVVLDRNQALPEARDHDIAAALDSMDALVRERSAARA